MNRTPSLRRWCLRFALAYSAIVVAVTLVLWIDTDDRAMSALFLYGPRWIAPLPLLLLVPLALIARSWRSLAVLAVTSLGVAGPLMGGRVAPATLFNPPPAYARYRVVSWNAGNANSTAAFRKFQDDVRPEVILLQESPAGWSRKDFPPGWTVHEGPGGLRMASRFPGRFHDGIGWDRLPLAGYAARFAIDTPDGEMTVYNIHLPTIRPGFEGAMASKLANLSELRTVLLGQAQASKIVRDWMGPPIGLSLIAGDFNMPVESPTYRRDWAGFPNAFSDAGNGWGGTKMTSWHRIRIDHVLYGTPFHCRRCEVGPDLGSDHRPVIAELTLEEDR